MTQLLLQHQSFHKDQPERLADGTLIQIIHYNLDGELQTYEATGEDMEDLEIDWAYKYLELFDKS